MIRGDKRSYEPMETEMLVIPFTGDAPIDSNMLSIPRDPGLKMIKRHVLPILQKQRPQAELEHVSVLYKGAPASMFVDDWGSMYLPVNKRATDIYWTNSLLRNPAADTSDWPRVYGTVVLFTRNVWF